MPKVTTEAVTKGKKAKKRSRRVKKSTSTWDDRSDMQSVFGGSEGGMSVYSEF